MIICGHCPYLPWTPPPPPHNGLSGESHKKTDKVGIASQSWDPPTLLWDCQKQNLFFCISLDILFVCIKLSQMFTVKHVLKYGEAEFVVSKKRKFWTQIWVWVRPPPPLGLCPKCFCFFKVTPPLRWCN